jgi:RND family efflux transporter MFP subunit
MATYKLHAVPNGQDASQAQANSPALQAHERVIIELIAASLEHKRFISVSNALVNELARHLKCDRVSLLLCKGRNYTPHAISNSASINPDAKIISLISAAMQEALDQKTTISYPDSKDDALIITTAHAQLANTKSQKTICTVLLTHMHEIIGAITLERPLECPFDDETLFFCQRLALLIGPLVLLKYEEEHWLLEHAWGTVKKHWARLTNRGNYTEKTLYGLAAVLLLIVSFTTGTHRVAGDAILEGKIQRMITSPIDGFISEVHVRAGDIVKAGQIMASLDDRELQLQKMKLQGEYDAYSREYRDARAKYDLTQVSIISAKMQQAKAELEIVKEQLKRLNMTAPFNGVVVEGNLEQALGSPVERGQVLLKLAPLRDYRIILKIDDRDIARINTQQTGQLALASMPGEIMKFTIKNITPVSIAEGGRNYFKVEAKLEQKNPLLRPGMLVIAKIEISQRKLIWIWSHRFTDWLRYRIWAW